MPVVIVAIPRKEDYVWRISSEKAPHITLLDLGEMSKSLNVSGIVDFLEHVASISMRRFGLDVDRRGELGPKKADVLFFGRHGIKRLEDIRHYLLTNQDIYKAYHSTFQFPTWVPHLTLGFPETPAKKDPREFPGISWVSFDRVALWTGNSEGPEFPLKSEDDTMEISMSSSFEEVLAHFGVKGMKWGVRNATPPTKGGGGSDSEDSARASAAKKKIKIGGTKALSNKELQDLVTRLNLERQLSQLNPPRSKKALQFVADILLGVGKQQITKIAADVTAKQVANILKKSG